MASNAAKDNHLKSKNVGTAKLNSGNQEREKREKLPIFI